MSKLNQPNKSPIKGPNMWSLALVIFVIVDLWAVNLLLGLNPKLFGDRGTFGDAFGASNALFSGLALAGVVYAVTLQRAEIRVAREELARTKEIFDEQSRSLSLQNFQNSFFQLLGLFTDVTNNIDLIGRKQTTGKDAFAMFEDVLVRTETGLRNANKKFDFETIYKAFYTSRQNDLGHYFRTLYTTLKFVENSDIEEKKFYTNILRAQLSNAELHILLYNGLSMHGKARLKPLLEKYEFFDNLPLAKVRYKDALVEYELGAFGHNEEILAFRRTYAEFNEPA